MPTLVDVARHHDLFSFLMILSLQIRGELLVRFVVQVTAGGGVIEHVLRRLEEVGGMKWAYEDDGKGWEDWDKDDDMIWWLWDEFSLLRIDVSLLFMTR